MEGGREYSEIHPPPQKLDHLSYSTRKWLGELRESDIEQLKEAIKWWGSARSVGKFLRWVFVVFAVTFGIFGGLAAFGDHVANIWKSFGMSK